VFSDALDFTAEASGRWLFNIPRSRTHGGEGL